MDKLAIATRLRVLQAQKGLSGKEIAHFIDKSEQTYSGYISMRKPQVPDHDTLISLAELYDVTVDYILRGEGKPGLEAGDLDSTGRVTAGQSADLLTSEESDHLAEIILAEYEEKLTEEDVEFIKYALRLDPNTRKFFIELAKTRLMMLEMEKQKEAKRK